jgi:hypothetical protein
MKRFGISIFLVGVAMWLGACAAIKEPVPSELAPAAQATAPGAPEAAKGQGKAVVMLSGVHLQVESAVLAEQFPAGCTAEAPACSTAQAGSRYLIVTFQPTDLPEGDMLDYKRLPGDLAVVDAAGTQVRLALQRYDPQARTLVLGFEVPGNAAGFRLVWDGAEILLAIQG